MIIMNAEIMFYAPDGVSAKIDGLSMQYPLRPSFNFGRGLLFSGTIKSNFIQDKFLFQNIYCVEVEFPTIEGEAYKAVQNCIKRGMNMSIQNGSHIIGTAKLFDFNYKD